jgi:hypothetical protein
MIISVQSQADLSSVVNLRHVRHPPKAFERHDAVVDAACRALHGELRAVGDGVQGFDGLAVLVRGVRVTVAIDHQVGQLGRVDDQRLTTGCVELMQLALVVDLLCCQLSRPARE